MGSIGLVTKKVTLKLSLKSILKCMWKGLFSKIENFNFSKNLLFLWSPHYYYYYYYCPLYLGKSLLRPYLCLTFYSLVKYQLKLKKNSGSIQDREKREEGNRASPSSPGNPNPSFFVLHSSLQCEILSTMRCASYIRFFVVCYCGVFFFFFFNRITLES